MFLEDNVMKSSCTMSMLDGFIKHLFELLMESEAQEVHWIVLFSNNENICTVCTVALQQHG